MKNSKIPCIVCLILGSALLLSACGGSAPRIYSSGGLTNSHEVAEVMFLASREEIVASGKVYEELRRAGIADNDIRNGSLALGRIFCCGGKGTVETEVPAAVYLPPDIRAERGDIVEYVVGAAPDGDDRGRLNTAIAIRNKDGVKSGTCRYVPEDPKLWMRVIHCDWMTDEGWTKGGGLHPVYFKPPR